MRALRLLPVLVLLGAVAVWAIAGFYDVAPDEQAVVLRLGRYRATEQPGQFRWHAPGIDRVLLHRVTAVLREEIGYSTSAAPPGGVVEHTAEKRMLTGDENVIFADFFVQYRISNLRDYLLNLRADERDAVIREAARAAVRSAVAQNTVDQVMTAKDAIHESARRELQARLDSYGAGVRVETVQFQDVDPPEPVREAFADVTSAQQDRERAVLEAQGYSDKVVPEARGRAEEALNLARAYRQRRILEAEGQATSFQAVLDQYRRAPQVTRQRLYLETLEQILPKMDKVILEKGGTEQVLPYLPLGRREAPR